MTQNEAIEIINTTRISNPFTMGLTFEQYINSVRRRYAIINSEIIDNNIVEIAKLLNNEFNVVINK